jgi:hypothetical protein
MNATEAIEMLRNERLLALSVSDGAIRGEHISIGLPDSGDPTTWGKLQVDDQWHVASNEQVQYVSKVIYIFARELI